MSQQQTLKVLVSAPYVQPVLDRFRRLFEENNMDLVVPRVRERLSEKELLPLVGDVDGVIAGDDRFTRRVLEAAPRLKVISKWGTGIDSIDREAAKELGIRVLNTPNAFSEPVADTVMGYVLYFARSIGDIDGAMRAGRWEKAMCRSLAECTIGVIGVGNVGKAVLRRARAFGSRLLGNDIVDIAREFVEEVGVEMVDKEALFRQSDFVSLNCTLNETSHHLVDSPQLEMMQQTACLINTARGPVVNEEALVQALSSGEIAGAALDVFEVEPLPPQSPLRRMENVLLSPHNANSSPRCWEYVHKNTVRNLLHVLRPDAKSV